MAAQQTYLFQGIERWQWIFDTPNYFAAFLATLIPFLWLLQGIAPARLLYSQTIKWTALVVEGFCWLTLIKTYSRGGLIAAVFSALAFSFFCRSRPAQWLLWRLCPLIVLGVYLGVGARVSPAYMAGDASAVNRLTQWLSSLEMIAIYPSRKGILQKSGSKQVLILRSGETYHFDAGILKGWNEAGGIFRVGMQGTQITSISRAGDSDGPVLTIRYGAGGLPREAATNKRKVILFYADQQETILEDVKVFEDGAMRHSYHFNYESGLISSALIDGRELGPFKWVAQDWTTPRARRGLILEEDAEYRYSYKVRNGVIQRVAVNKTDGRTLRDIYNVFAARQAPTQRTPMAEDDKESGN